MAALASAALPATAALAAPASGAVEEAKPVHPSRAVRYIRTANFPKEVWQSKGYTLVGFWNPKCKDCHAEDRPYAALAKIFGDRVKVVKINAAEPVGFNRMYGVKTTPTMVLFKDGRPVQRWVGKGKSREIAPILNLLVPPAGR